MGETFSTSAQYNDWTGRVAADELDKKIIAGFIKNKANLPENAFIVGIEFFRHAPAFVSCSAAYITTNSYDNAQDFLSNSNNKISKVDVELSEMEFLTLFKRFSVVMERKGLSVIGREYSDV